MRPADALRGLALLCLLTAAAPQKSSQIRVEAQVRPDKLTVGDRATLKVKFTAAPEALITAAFSATQFESWELSETAPPKTGTGKDGGIDRTFEFQLIPWSATLTATPSLPFRVELPGRWEKTISIAPQKIEMESVLAKAEDTGDLRPLRGLIGYRSLLPFLIAAGILILGVIAWAIWRYRKRGKIVAHPGPPPKPPAEMAREALDQLLASDLLERGEIKLFYTALSEIPRRYIEGRFGIPALDRTTPELLPELRRRPELRELYPDMRRFLETCDLVKFAKHAPDEQDINRDVACARRLVETTALLDSPVTENQQ